MLVLATLSDASEILILVVLLAAVVYLGLIRRALVCLIRGIADRHVELRIDLKYAGDARERQHQETLQAFSTVPGDLKQFGTFAQAITEALKHPDDRKTVEMEPLALPEQAVQPKEQPPTVRGAKLQSIAAPKGAVAQGGGEHPSETDEKTDVWSGSPSGRTLVGIGASTSSPAALGGHVGAGPSGG